MSQKKPQPIWESILANQPELFIWSGDNVYGDTDQPDKLRAAYEMLKAVPGYQQLRQQCPVAGTWDDHDYGKNDAGVEWVIKKESQQIFLDFFGVPDDSRRREQEGIYHSFYTGPRGRRMQVILLDTRYFRSPLDEVPRKERVRGQGKYRPTQDTTRTLLGEAQWEWLEKQLRQPAELRLLVSSIQVVAGEHGWEHWSNLPHERERLLDLVRDTKAHGLMVISGDRHHGEFSILPDRVGYPLHDITSSGLNRGRPPVDEPNRFRVGELCFGNNFGLITVDWNEADPLIALEIRDADNQVRLHREVLLSELQPGRW